MLNNYQLIPEWAPQEAVILAWPDSDTDWAPYLEAVQQVYIKIIQILSTNQTGVILLVRQNQISTCLAKLPKHLQVLLLEADYNDTWLRDYGFLTCQKADGPCPIEFNFNGWGKKFRADRDDKINRQVLASLCKKPIEHIDVVLEGGAIEINDLGTILSTQLCLTNPSRNGSLSLNQYREIFAQSLGAKETIVFKHGHLEGDDTDGHIDTLVRFTPNQGLVIQSAFNCPQDRHYVGLNQLVIECKSHLPSHTIFELPLPNVYNQQGDRLPASYANFLISNGTVLAPIYQQPEDALALSVLEKAFCNYEVIPIDCLPLVQQYGSLHCISMQVPVDTLKPDVIALFAKGVSQYVP